MSEGVALFQPIRSIHIIVKIYGFEFFERSHLLSCNEKTTISPHLLTNEIVARMADELPIKNPNVVFTRPAARATRSDVDAKRNTGNDTIKTAREINADSEQNAIPNNAAGGVDAI